MSLLSTVSSPSGLFANPISLVNYLNQPILCSCTKVTPSYLSDSAVVVSFINLGNSRNNTGKSFALCHNAR